MEGEHHKRTNLKNKRAMEIEKLKTVVALANALAEELKAEYNAFEEKKSEWYYKNLMLNNSGLMSNDDFERNVWEEYQENLGSGFDSQIFALRYGVEKIMEGYESFKSVKAHLDRLVEEEPNMIPDGWKMYDVNYIDKDDKHVICRRYFAPDAEKAVEICKRHMGNCLVSVQSVEEVSQ